MEESNWASSKSCGTSKSRHLYQHDIMPVFKLLFSIFDSVARLDVVLFSFFSMHENLISKPYSYRIKHGLDKIGGITLMVHAALVCYPGCSAAYMTCFDGLIRIIGILAVLCAMPMLHTMVKEE